MTINLTYEDLVKDAVKYLDKIYEFYEENRQTLQFEDKEYLSETNEMRIGLRDTLVELYESYVPSLIGHYEDRHFIRFRDINEAMDFADYAIKFSKYCYKYSIFEPKEEECILKLTGESMNSEDNQHNLLKYVV